MKAPILPKPIAVSNETLQPMPTASHLALHAHGEARSPPGIVLRARGLRHGGHAAVAGTLHLGMARCRWREGESTSAERERERETKKKTYLLLFWGEGLVVQGYNSQVLHLRACCCR